MHTIKIRCRGIVIYEDRLLVVDHGHTPSFFNLPGGVLEFGEDPKECVGRELKEELGVSPDVGDVLYIHTYRGNEHQSVEFFFEIKNPDAFIGCEQRERTHAHEIAQIRWITKKDDVTLLPHKAHEDFKNEVMLAHSVRHI